MVVAFVRLSFWEGCCPSVLVPPQNAMTVLTPKRRFSLFFALCNILQSSSHSHRVSPLCSALQTNGRTDGQCCWRRFQCCRNTNPPSWDISILIKTLQFGCLYACCQNVSELSQLISRAEHREQSLSGSPGTLTRRETQNPLP